MNIPASEYERAEQMAVRAAECWWRKRSQILPVGWDIDDARQAARIEVYRAASRYDPKVGSASFSTFVYKTALGAVQKAARDYAEMQRKDWVAGTGQPPRSLEERITSAESESKAITLAEQIPSGYNLEADVLDATVWEYVSQLPAKYVGVLHCRFREQLTQQETADRLGYSQMHISRLERRALQRLKEQLMAAERDPNLSAGANIERWLDEGNYDLSQSVPGDTQQLWAEKLGTSKSSVGAQISLIRGKRKIKLTAPATNGKPPAAAKPDAPAPTHQPMTLRAFVRAKLLARGVAFSVGVDPEDLEAWAKERGYSITVIQNVIKSLRAEEATEHPGEITGATVSCEAKTEPAPEIVASPAGEDTVPVAAEVDFDVKSWEDLYNEAEQRIKEMEQVTLERMQENLFRATTAEEALANTERLLDEANRLAENALTELVRLQAATPALPLATDTLTSDERTVAHFCFNGWDQSDDAWMERHPLRRAAILQLAADMSRTLAGVATASDRDALPAKSRVLELWETDFDLVKRIHWGMDVQQSLIKLNAVRQAAVFRTVAVMAEAIVARIGK